ncbi:fumarylacetoacetate hydrolase family protein [Desulfococcus multivorans]|uniref:Fumarylacetoacetate (FAA) hydrolase n=1 Tax=Desulfococcus multivorans DSM 2059 TaxID=1121405 RepID=S7TPG2_DESML|nr:fumarylacetoacetate hydrolase family protein [Desulfococcus multivorans]AOY57708.1 ureidoglycolate lyase (Ureidoglycolase) [Desulfococcus multivorans]AQV00105.1 fumarylacetoacetate hydrolase [Desulfococcus multivorans]EPR38791.1 fumarylacetoacetate (FAA) hydrolase [Desulfococcus multivorans DSM 2059]SJZ79490.1 2-keto-4-pentenoate hydratase/2-oxohepta-3-ene-1,7-dioic acid hydratase (catechol pathway) [Desulfococcus multivorans DSM 2059]
MRLIRFGDAGMERPGLLKAGRIVDLRKHFPDIPDIGEEFFVGGWLKKAAALSAPGETMAVRLGPPVHRPSKIICLGKNYLEHAREGGFEPPTAPLLFAKAPSSLTGPADVILLPASSGQIDWEVELAVIIGKTGKRIDRRRAFEHIAGFAVMNDISGREAQFGDGQWFRGKSFDTFAPLGPAVVTPDELSDVNDLRLETWVNGRVMQTGTTRDMIFDIPSIIDYVSRDITLIPGDIVSTGTPSGVGIFRDPPITLADGDIVECSIEGIGTIRNRVTAQ